MQPLTTNQHLNSFMQAVIVTDAQRRGARTTNDQDQSDIRQRSEVSDCCHEDIGYSGLHTYCTECGESCMVIVPTGENI